MALSDDEVAAFFKDGFVLKKALFSKYKMQWQLYFTDEKPRMVVFVSESSHCIYDIFSRYFSDEWFVEIPAILSNHRTHEELA